MGSVCSMTLLGDNTAVTFGDDGKTNKIKSYDLITGAELCLLENASSLAEVKLGQNLALALSNRSVFSTQKLKLFKEIFRLFLKFLI